VAIREKSQGGESEGGRAPEWKSGTVRFPDGVLWEKGGDKQGGKTRKGSE